MDQVIQKTLDGYQHIENDITKPGDVWVSAGEITGEVRPPFLGMYIQEAEERVGSNVYRRMLVYKQGDNDPSWREALREVENGKADTIKGLSRKQMNQLEQPILKKAFDEPLVGDITPTNKALTYDDGKPPLANLPWAGVREVAMVQAYGHAKYKDFNNFRKGMEVSRNLSCAIRHISEYMDGNDLDSGSGRNHLAHAACRLLFVLQNIHDKTAIDDRYKPR